MVRLVRVEVVVRGRRPRALPADRSVSRRHVGILGEDVVRSGADIDFDRQLRDPHGELVRTERRQGLVPGDRVVVVLQVGHDRRPALLRLDWGSGSQ